MLHPLQTLMSPEQGVRSLSSAAFGLCGDRDAMGWGEEVVCRATGGRGRTLRIDADRLSYYHAGAVMASNALVAAIDAAVILLGRAGVERPQALRALGPLAHASLDNTLANGPQAALTGPVVRGDAATVAAHTRALRDADASVSALYRATTKHLLEIAKQRGLPQESVRAVELALERTSHG
jgi:predicted short-subunit dehydrogenase-like oxidoreductase (DUF2520 family)